MTFQEQHFDLGNGRHLAAKVWGARSDKRLLCFHGWLDNAASFDWIAPKLMDQAQLIAVDMVGHGFSDHLSQGANYYVWEASEDIYRLLDVLGIDQANIIGHSLGGAVSSIFAGTFPERVQKLALIEAIGPYAMTDEQSPSLLARAISGRVRRESQRTCYQDVDSIVRAKQIANGLSESAARAIVERNLERVKDGYCWRSDPRLKQSSAWRVTEAQLRSFFGAITAETLLILGEEGMFNEEIVSLRMSPIQSLSKCWIPGHHHLHMEPETAPAVVAALKSFFEL